MTCTSTEITLVGTPRRKRNRWIRSTALAALLLAALAVGMATHSAVGAAATPDAPLATH